MRSKLFICAIALPVSLAGCSAVDPGYGEALRYDMAIQTIDPDPVYPADARKPGDHGEKAQKATERYRKGQVKSPASGGISGGSAGGVGGGSTPGS